MSRRFLFLFLLLSSCSSSVKTEPPVMEQPPPPLGQSEAISEEEAARLLQRLTPFSQPTKETPGFSLREGTLQKPPTFKTIEQSFPPPPGRFRRIAC